MSIRQKAKSTKVKKLTIDLYTFIYNDEDILPFFLKYYDFVDRMTFIDSGSSDNSLQIIHKYTEKATTQVRIIQTGLTWWDHETLHEYRNNIWNNSKADFIFFPDCDEFFYRLDLLQFMSDNYNYFDIYEMEGFEMVSDSYPKENILEIKKGVHFHMYNKSTIFKPTSGVQFLNAHLRYSINPKVNMGDVYLLHYRNLGIEQIKKRRDRERERLPADCKYRQFMTDREIEIYHQDLMKKAIKII